MPTLRATLVSLRAIVEALDNKYERHMPARVEAEIAKDPESDYSTAAYRIVPPGVVKVTFFDPPGTERKWIQDPEYWYRGMVIRFNKNGNNVGGSWEAGKLSASRHQGLKNLITQIDAKYPGQSKILRSDPRSAVAGSQQNEARSR